MLEFFNIDKFFLQNFACRDQFFSGRQEAGTTNFFLEKSHMSLGTCPHKKGWGIHFGRNFLILRKKISQNFLGDERRERWKEGTNDTTSPRPNSKTW
jgi:hypothetical protein